MEVSSAIPADQFRYVENGARKPQSVSMGRRRFCNEMAGNRGIGCAISEHVGTIEVRTDGLKTSMLRAESVTKQRWCLFDIK